MNKKNILNQKDPGNKKSNNSGWKNLTAGAVMLASVLSTNLWYNQDAKYPIDLQKKNTIELVDKNVDSLDHGKIIHIKFDSILKEYGSEKWLEIIRNHMLIEINTYRKLNKKQPLSSDSTLNEATQKFAEYGSPYKALWHYFDGKWVEDMWVNLDNYLNMSENVAYGSNDIATTVSDRYHSEGHKKNMIGLNVSKYTWKTIPYSLLGIGLSWKFIVAEFATPIK